MAQQQILDPLLPSKVIHQFPLPTWIENIAVRSNGQLLVTLLTTPDLYLIDPFTSPAKTTLVHSFTETLALSGIIEGKPDIWYIAGGDFNVAKYHNEQGTYKVWEVDLSTFDQDRAAKVKKIADVPGSGLLNGMELLSASKGKILIADSEVGCVWKVDVQTGEHDIAIQVDEMKVPKEGLPMGINGIKIRDGYLYWSNTGMKYFCRIKIDESCKAIGTTEILAKECLIDDFIFDKKGNAWLAQNTLNTVGVVKVDGGVVTVAGHMDKFDVAGGAACQFGKTPEDEHTLYVVTTGGLAAPVKGEMEGGKVAAVDTTQFIS